MISEKDIELTNISLKRIAIIGRARGGKSFLNSRFVSNRTDFIKLFCGNNSDKTVCPIHIKIAEGLKENFIFHTDFNTIYHLGSDDSEVEVLKKRISELVDNRYSHEDVERMTDIESVIRDIRSIEERNPNLKSTNTYIDTFHNPSEFCKEILDECSLGSIEIIDTPGVSGNVEASEIAKSDMYLFLVKPDNSEESQTLRRIVTQIKADVATSKVAFLYKKEGTFLTLRKYENARKSVRKDMEAYSELFNDLKGSIISTELDVLDPARHCILFPTMDEEEVILSEELFLKDMKEKLLDAFESQDDTYKDEEFKKIILEYKEEAKEFIFDIMNNIPKHEFGKGKQSYSINEVINSNHDRVKSNDSYRLYNDLKYAYNRESNILDEYFSAFTDDEYQEEWQQVIIKYLYRELIASVRYDRGIGLGKHPFESCPARTMLVEESILADKLIDNIKEDRIDRNLYIKVLKDNNITSKTWECVYCEDSDEALTKLKIVKEHEQV